MSGIQMPREVTFFKEWIPNPVRVCLCVFFALSFQFSGGIYLSAVSEMVGDLALLQEDIMMTGYASFVGMTMIFPVLFRLKFRFTARSMLMVICPVLVVCNFITMSTESLPVLVITSFVAGTFRMWGTFECFSNMQLSLTANRDFTIFFPFIYAIILGSIELSGLLTVNLSWYMDWRYMHLFIMGLLLFVWLLVTLLTRHFRLAPPVPLKGIDWIGWVLWSIFLLCGIFVCEYGCHYDWFDSPYIRMAAAVCAVSLLLSVMRMFRMKNAYAGVIIGCGLTWLWLHVMKGGFKFIVFFGFATPVLYQCMMYFLLDPGMNIELLYIPVMLMNAGHAAIYAALTVYPVRVVPFQHFFQTLSLMGFVRSGLGAPFASAVYGRLMDVLVPQNMQLLSAEMDAVNGMAAGIPLGALYGSVAEQALLVSMKQIYGWVSIAGIAILVFILAYRQPGPVMVFKTWLRRRAGRWFTGRKAVWS
ncbi:MAG: hypothetical protein IAC23_04615 [Bacteroidetes bacterium]|uniref:MFS transporter n=1 Tax=Candidatus Cryptobacteroides merdavium TaxID=2840769 RepID=A0A9D9HB36_9BACT|nr:hypothetical protein [Candidatus Cryptobacteroides merdavium]